MNKLFGALVSTIALAGLMSSRAHAGVPYPDAKMPSPVDLGALDALAGAAPLSFTVALRLPNIDEAESLVKSINTPGDPQYHKFLSANEFVARFAPSNAAVAQVVAELAKYGLTAERTSATTLTVSGLPANIERAFAVNLSTFEVPAHGNVPGYTFHAPATHPTIPSEILPSVAAVVGLDNRATFRPLSRSAPPAMAPRQPTAPNAATGNPFGSLTVTDFAGLYDVQPLYNRGATGSGRTMAILTFASFTPSDAFSYWNALGLSVNRNRIKVVNIDGGPGAPSDASGSMETTIDVEQSGGVAPGANIIVYQAPNTNQAFVDLFAAAIDADVAQSVSISWGEWEWFDNIENSPVKDPSTGRTVGALQAVHELLVRAAIQGQSVFASAGDGGAYEVNDDLACYGPYSSKVKTSCATTLTVGYPASDPYVTAAGGTTLPGAQEFCLTTACTTPFVVNVPHERVWGWDYLDGLCSALGQTPLACGIYAAGGGGGVSIEFAEPFYQYGIVGIQSSQPGQVFEVGSALAAEDGIDIPYYALPGFYPGRNVPDVSFNADPDTGYVVYYTSSVSGYGLNPGWGGTSFVAPQLNGVAALLGQYAGVRGAGLGLLNNSLYGLVSAGQAYGGSNAPLHVIAYGDNWFYNGRNGYSPAAGVGTLDVFNFAQLLRELY
jgi:kumamolisin